MDKASEHPRHSFTTFVDWGFKLLLTGLVGLGVTQIRDVTNSISELNKNMAAVIERLANQSKTTLNHENRLLYLERNCRGCRPGD